MKNFRIRIQLAQGIQHRFAEHDNIAGRIPAWYRDKINAPTFLLLPLVINKRIVGMFYADRDQTGELTIEPDQLRLLKTLRNQAVLAIRQKF